MGSRAAAEEAGAGPEGRPRPPSITVVMPNYNHAHYIEAALGAVLEQLRRADQIIVIDDASSDNSVSVIERLVAGRPEVEVVRNAARGGVIKAMNAGLERATGDLVALLAADDMIYPEFLSECAVLIAEHPEAGFVSASVEVHDERGRYVSPRPFLRPSLSPRYVSAAETRRLFRRGDNFFLGAATIYRRQALIEMGGFDETLGSAADGMLQRRMAVRSGFCFVPRPLAMWRIHGNNFSLASVTNPTTLSAMVQRMRAVIEAEPEGLFPPHYGDLLERRLRFNASRLIAEHVAAEPEALERFARCMAASDGERRLLAALARTGRLAPALLTALAAMRLRPFSPVWSAREALSRVLQGKGMRPGGSGGAD